MTSGNKASERTPRSPSSLRISRWESLFTSLEVTGRLERTAAPARPRPPGLVSRIARGAWSKKSPTSPALACGPTNPASRATGPTQPRPGVAGADPRQAEPSRFDSDAARRLQKLLTVADTHDCAIDAAQHCVDAVKTGDAPLRPNVLRDVLQGVEPAQATLRIRVAGNGFHHLADVDPAAVTSPKAVFHFLA